MEIGLPDGVELMMVTKAYKIGLKTLANLAKKKYATPKESNLFGPTLYSKLAADKDNARTGSHAVDVN